MKILLINTPSRKGKAGFWMPLGLIYAGSIIERCGHKPVIIDPYLGDIELSKFDSGDFSMIKDAIDQHDPSIIGYGGIATSYGRAKKLSNYIRSRYPHILQIAGGPLASVYKLLLTKTDIDVVFHGETEVSLPIFLKNFERKGPLGDTPGISYTKDGSIVMSSMPEQIKDLDSIPVPSFDLVDVDNYLLDMQSWFDSCEGLRKYGQHYSGIAKKMHKNDRCIPIVTSRGCTHRCSFCYRHYRGARQHSVSYMIDMIKHLKDKYMVDGFQLGDELFNLNPQWVSDFCDALQTNKLNIVYRIAGARVDKVNEKMLTRLKETGCVAIDYGQESGSDIILKEYGKGVTAAQNKDVFLLTTKIVGIPSTVQLVIGSPSETDATISETVKFLKEASAYPYSLNYLIPLPETPIWKYVEANGLIKDTEMYLALVAERGGSPLVNLTSAPNLTWERWGDYIRSSMKTHAYRDKPVLYHIYDASYKLISSMRPIIPVGIKKFIPKWIKRLY